MNARFTHLLAVAAVAAVTATAPAAERGKKAVVRLFTDATAKATDATVRVRCDNKDAALGTVVSANGYILTKGSELKGAISVRLRDGSEYDAEYVGYDEKTDLAMLKIDATDLPAVAFAPGTEAAVGNWVAAVGPESEPLAVGVISAGVRKLYGPEAVIEKQNKGYLGILAGGAPDDASADGVEIGEVDPRGAAFRAKLRAGDVILKVAGKSVKSFNDLRKVLEDYKPGETVKLVYRRGEDEKEIDLKLIPKSDIDRGDFQNKMGSSLSNRRTGFPAVIMHDTVIKPQECGGPLVDLDGKVLGVNIARAGRVETWTLPAEVITPVVKDLKAGKYPAPGREKGEKVKAGGEK
jgi:serine protease Do